jgi:hypothetical protein
MHAPEQDSSPTQVLIVLVVIHLGLLALMLGRAFDPLFNDAMHRMGPGTDFRIYFRAAQAWSQGDGMYGDTMGFGYRYHPAFAIVIAVTLGKLKLATAHLVWTAILEVALWSLIPGIRRSLQGSRRATSLALLFLFSPFFLEAYLGQCSFLAGVLLWHASQALQARRQWLCAATIAAAILIKPIALVICPVLLVRGEWRILIVSLAVPAGLATIYFVDNAGGFEAFLRVNFEAVTKVGWVVHAGNQGMHGFLASLFARVHEIPTHTLAGFDDFPLYARTVLVGLPWLLVALSAVATWRLRERPEIAIALWSCTFLLGYKDVWEHTYSFLLPCVLLLLRSDAISRRLVIVCAVGLALPTGFVLYDVPMPPGPYDPEHAFAATTSILHHATKPIWVLTLYVACLWRAYRPLASATASNQPLPNRESGSM